MVNIYHCQNKECGWFGFEIFENSSSPSCPECRSNVENVDPKTIPNPGRVDYKDIGDYEIWLHDDSTVQIAMKGSDAPEDSVIISIDELESVISQSKKFLRRCKTYKEHCIEL